MQFLKDTTHLNAREVSLLDILRLGVAVYWPCYNHTMEIVNYPNNHGQIGATGDCPHCHKPSNFAPVGPAYLSDNTHICQSVQCIGCHKYGIVIGWRGDANSPFKISEFYPAGVPNVSVDPNIPAAIAEDLREALRCQWVRAYRGAVVMCRRAIQATCVDKKMADAKLQLQIDEMASKGLITEPLKQWAHEVRLGGNDGAHPDKDGLKDVAEQDADEIIQFTREFLHHIYVMPAALAARQASRAAPKPSN